MPSTEADLPSLDLIGIAEGTNKHSLHLDYLRQYQRMFSRFRHEPIDLMEIGVFNGASLCTWRRFFTRARIIGVDINPRCARHAGDNVVVEIGSQEDPEFCSYLCWSTCPTIIIDDGSHLAFDVEFTFERLFPALQPGGCYAIEDIIFHFGPNAEQVTAGAAVSLPAYLDSMQRRLLGEPRPAGERGFRRWFARVVDRIEIFKSGAAIWRKAEEVELTDGDIDQIERLTAISNTAEGWDLLAKTLLDRGETDRAERAARRAVALEDTNSRFLIRLSRVLERKRDIEQQFSMRLSCGRGSGGEFGRQQVRVNVRSHQNRGFARTREWDSWRAWVCSIRCSDHCEAAWPGSRTSAGA